MDDIKTYIYPKKVEINFKEIADKYGLSEKTPFQTCLFRAKSYINGRDCIDRYLINNEDEIAKDLFHYLRRNKKESTTITPQIKAELNHALDELNNYIQNYPIKEFTPWYIKKAWEHMRNIPFLKDKSRGQDIYTITPQIEFELGYALDNLNYGMENCRLLQIDPNKGVKEAWEILRNIPFLKED